MKKVFVKKFILIIAIFFPVWLTGLTPLLAQSAGYFMELRFIQRLTWVGDAYAMRYEVIIEKDEAGRYRRFLQEFTRENFITVSLVPGNYRYQVVPYDYLDQPIPVHDWVKFEVLRGDSKLATGRHEIIIMNPFDERNRAEIILVSPEERSIPKEKSPEYKNQFDIYLGTAWMPLFPVNGESQFFESDFSLLGAAMRIGIVSGKQNTISPGIELTAFWRAFESASGNQMIHSLAFDLNLLAQVRFSGNRTAFNFRLGTGVSMMPDTYPLSSAGDYSIYANAGISFLCMIMKNLYFETGVDYSQFFTRDYFGFLRPWVGVGYRF